ncbi:MAG: DUF1365 domain-containing protein [Gammaproteobacteria bacterium]|nr:DUF1365 domain-containing protein [Gammaproteobacteria bacterium]
MNSALYQGFVRHRRFGPKPHHFRYPLFMAFLKLDEIQDLTDKLWLFGTRPWHWARFRREDYPGNPTIPLGDVVKQRIADQAGIAVAELDGDVYFYGHLRYLGFYFSPLNLYFVEQQGRVRYMLAEVSNTPWNERHYYSLDLDQLKPHNKEFHVSPFNPMSQTYRWRVTPPGITAAKSMVHLEVLTEATETPIFDATMVLKRHSLNQSNLLRVLMKTPMQTLRMVVGIYWQATKLFFKRIPVYGHPKKQKTNSEHSSPTADENGS